MSKEKIEIYEQVTSNSIDKNYMLRELLILYGVRERFFYHHGEYPSYDYDIWRHTNLLRECTEERYNTMISDSEEVYKYNPVKYMSDNIPDHEILDRILYTR